MSSFNLKTLFRPQLWLLLLHPLWNSYYWEVRSLVSVTHVSHFVSGNFHLFLFYSALWNNFFHLIYSHIQRPRPPSPMFKGLAVRVSEAGVKQPKGISNPEVLAHGWWWTAPCAGTWWLGLGIWEGGWAFQGGAGWGIPFQSPGAQGKGSAALRIPG